MTAPTHLVIVNELGHLHDIPATTQVIPQPSYEAAYKYASEAAAKVAKILNKTPGHNPTENVWFVTNRDIVYQWCIFQQRTG